MKTDVDILGQFKEDAVLLVKQISTCWGVTIRDEDIYFVLSIYNNLNQDKIVNDRYSSQSITESHPLISDIKKKYAKDKHKKERIKNELNKLQIFFKDTNKLLSIVALLLLTIQCSVPSYKNKYNYKLSLIGFKDISLQNLTFDTKVIDYCIVKLNKLATSENDSFWLNYSQLSSEERTYELVSVKQQIHNLIHNKLINSKIHLLL